MCFSICCRPMFVSHLLEVIMTFPKFVACCKNHTHFTCNLTGALSPAQKTSTWSCAVCQAGGGGRDPLTPGLREMRSCCPGWGVEASFNAVRIPWNSPERLAWDPANNGNILSLGNDYPKFLMKSKGTCGTLCRTLRMAQIGRILQELLSPKRTDRHGPWVTPLAAPLCPPTKVLGSGVCRRRAIASRGAVKKAGTKCRCHSAFALT